MPQLKHADYCDITRGKPCSCGTEELEEEFSPSEMSGLKIILDGDGAWPDLKGKKVHHVTQGIQISRLGNGTKSGKPSVAIRIDLPDGSVVVAETTLRLLSTAAAVLDPKYKMEG